MEWNSLMLLAAIGIGFYCVLDVLRRIHDQLGVSNQHLSVLVGRTARFEPHDDDY